MVRPWCVRDVGWSGCSEIDNRKFDYAAPEVRMCCRRLVLLVGRSRVWRVDVATDEEGLVKIRPQSEPDYCRVSTKMNDVQEY